MYIAVWLLSTVAENAVRIKNSNVQKSWHPAYKKDVVYNMLQKRKMVG